MVRNATRSPVSALYTLYSLISYGAMTSEENIPETKGKGSVTVPINSLYVLSALVSYIVHADDDLDNETNVDNITETFAITNVFSALYREVIKEPGKDGEGYNSWTGYLIIAVTVVAAVALIIVAASCLTKHCRRNKACQLDKKVMVCHTTCSPSI